MASPDTGGGGRKEPMRALHTGAKEWRRTYEGVTQEEPRRTYEDTTNRSKGEKGTFRALHKKGRGRGDP